MYSIRTLTGKRDRYIFNWLAHPAIMEFYSCESGKCCFSYER